MDKFHSELDGFVKKKYNRRMDEGLYFGDKNIIKIAEFTGDSIVSVRGELVRIPNIKREVYYDPYTGFEDIYFSPGEARKVDEFLKERFPDIYK